MTFALKVGASALALALVLTGCSSVSLDDADKAGALSGENAASANGNGITNPFADPSNPLSQRSVYFGFDSYEVEQKYAPAVQAHAQFLKVHPDVSIQIQGNTDERGGREYNLSLIHI
mgnify:FL=1